MENDQFIKMRGVFAVPGAYTKDGKTYIKTAEELKDAAERYPIIPITFGHTQNSEPPSKDQQIGTMSQKWSKTQNKVLADYWFDKKKMPAILRSRAYDGKGIPISAWYLADDIDEDGTLHGMSYSHVAALEGEDPVCPLTECGAFVVSESKTSPRHIFVERLEDVEIAQTENKETEASPIEAEPVTTEEAEIEQPKPEVPVEQKPKEADVVPVVEEEEVPLEPEIIIPPSVPVVQKAFEVIDGKYVFVPDIFKQKQEKK